MTELLIAITVQAYLIHLERTEEAWCNAGTERNVHRWASMLSEEACIAQGDENVLAWACLMLVAVTERKCDTRQWAERILVQLHISEDEQRRLGENFLLIP